MTKRKEVKGLSDIEMPKKRSDLRLKLGRCYYGMLRRVMWLKMDQFFAKEREMEPLPYRYFSHKTILLRKLKDVDMEASEKEFRHMEAIILSMTPEERRDPNLLNASRRKRISAGCGLPVSKINHLVRQYEEAKKLMKQYSMPGKRKKLPSMFRGL